MDDDEKRELLKQLRNGNNGVVNVLIEGHLRLTVSIVARYIKLLPTRSDEILEEACVALVQAVHQLKESENDNVTASITVWIHKHLSTYLRSQRRSDEIIFTVPKSVGYHDVSMLEVREIINLICKNEKDKLILDMRMKGYVDTEIAAELGISQQRVTKKREKLGERYNDLCCNIR